MNAGVTPPAPGDPATPPPTPPAGEPGQAPTQPTIEELQQQIERMQAALKVANKSDEQRRKKLEEFEKAEQARRDAELSEAEKLKNRIAELEAGVTEREREINSFKLRDVIAAALAGAVDKAKITFASETAKQDALDVLMAQVSLDDSGKAVGFDDAFKQLQKERDYLFRAAALPPPNINAQNRNQSATDAESRAKELAQRFRLPIKG
jgi:hypothetical protein